MLTISTFSLILLKSVSRAMNTDYFKTQLVVTVAGLLAALVLSFIDYESIASFWYLIAGFSVFIMLYTMLFGISVQGDDGAAIVFFFMFLCMSLGGGVQLRYFILLGALVAVSVPVLWKFVLSEYQIKRFTSVYNLDDPSIQLNEGYQQVQGRISIGSGQLTGKGLFNGPRVETNLVTFQHSDFIFSVAGEELGFIGCTAIIVLLLLYLLRVLYIASKARDDLGRCMCFGFFGLIALQSVSNIGMCLALLPVMGVTLPFFSAGGSSAVCLYLGFGLIQSVYMHRPDANVPHLRSTRTLKMNFRKLNA